MRVMLLKDVVHLGQKGDIKEVKDGYARNFLIPSGFAGPATSQTIKEAESLRKTQEGKIVAKRSAFELELILVKELMLELHAKTNEQGGLFRAISKRQIVSELKKHDLKEIAEENLFIEEPIKKTGNFEIIIKKDGIEDKLKLKVLEKKDK